MEAKRDSGILFSRVLVWVFGVLILILDWAVWPISRWLMLFIVDMRFRDTVLLIICLYVCNVPGFVLLWCMDKLLRNLRQGKVFDSDNVGLLKNISICCFVVSVIAKDGNYRKFGCDDGQAKNLCRGIGGAHWHHPGQSIHS